MPKKLDRCVKKVKAQQKKKGKSDKEAERSAYAICTASMKEELERLATIFESSTDHKDDFCFATRKFWVFVEENESLRDNPILEAELRKLLQHRGWSLGSSTLFGGSSYRDLLENICNE